MTRENAKAIGSTLGKVECVEEFAKGDCRGHSMWVQININITQPLCKGWIVNIGGPKPQWISFKYECMPILCFGVGSWTMMRRIEAIGELSRYLTEERTTIWGLDACHHREISGTPYYEE